MTAPRAEGLVRVTRAEPCAICGRSTWCGRTADGSLALCARVAEGASRTAANGAHVHVLAERTRLPPPRVIRRTPPPDARMADLHAAHHELAERTGAVDRLADLLGVAADALRELATGWAGRAWSWPMRDALGRVVGMRYRGVPRHEQRTARWCERGSRLGVVGPVPADGPIVVCEGESDAAAARTLGVPAIAVPGAGTAADVVADLARGRDLVLIVDADEPGRAGGRRITSRSILPAQSVRVVEPPRGAGDLREALHAGMTRGELLDAIAAAEQARIVVRRRSTS